MKKALLITTLSAALALSAASYSAPELGETRSMLKEWVEFKKLISEESSDWEVEKEMLNESISLLEKEIEDLSERIQAKEEQASLGEKERQKLTEEQEQLSEASSVVKNVISDLEEQVLSLSVLFPPVLADQISLIIERIPKDEQAAKKLSLSNRILYILGVLKEVEKFNDRVTLDTTTQEINGENVRVKTIYLGLGVGYYVDETGKEAGVLRPGPNGWKKEVDNDLVDPIAQAVAILESEAKAAFVLLPMSVN